MPLMPLKLPTLPTWLSLVSAARCISFLLLLFPSLCLFILAFHSGSSICLSLLLFFLFIFFGLIKAHKPEKYK
ncbi:hypothetical protein BDF21DRAFT_428884 [Thamnidium elegans]|nr:hypothetical protein BDF21DRAFT_428884 [Thamnidium elegans]